MRQRDAGNSTEETVDATSVSRLVAYVYSAASAIAASGTPNTSVAFVTSTSRLSSSGPVSSSTFPISTSSSTAIPVVTPTSITGASSTPQFSSSTASSTSTFVAVGSASTGRGNPVGDRTVAIILGSVLGSLAILFALIIFFCLWRRRRTLGRYTRRPRVSLAPTESEVNSWRRPRSSTLESIHPATSRVDRQLRISAPNIFAPPLPAYPAFARERISEPDSQDYPFFNQQHSRVDFARRARPQSIRGDDLNADGSSTTNLEQPAPAPYADSPTQGSASSSPFDYPIQFLIDSPRGSSESASQGHDLDLPRTAVDRARSMQSSLPQLNPFVSEQMGADESPGEPSNEEDGDSPILSPMFQSPGTHPEPNLAMHRPSPGEVTNFDFAFGRRGHRASNALSSGTATDSGGSYHFPPVPRGNDRQR